MNAKSMGGSGGSACSVSSAGPNSGSYPIANAEAADAASLEQEFRCSIDSYFEGCEELQSRLTFGRDHSSGSNTRSGIMIVGTFMAF